MARRCHGIRQSDAPASIASDAVTAFVGVDYATVEIVGFFRREISSLTPVVMSIAGAAAILPDLHIRLAAPRLVSGRRCEIGDAAGVAESRASDRVIIHMGEPWLGL